MPAIAQADAGMTWLLRSESRRTPKTDRVGRAGLDGDGWDGSTGSSFTPAMC